MISWILGGILFLWCLINRFSKNGKIESEPLGMPRGTVRALITIIIVSFPLNYLIIDKAVPSPITNAIFVLVAFYFDARKGSKTKLELIDEIKFPNKIKKEKSRMRMPLYLPRFSVRSLLLTLLITIIIVNSFGPNVPFESLNTLFDIFIIVSLFFIGNLVRLILKYIEKQVIRHKVLKVENFETLASKEILEIINSEKKLQWKKFWRDFLSISTFILIILSLIAFSINWDFVFLSLPYYEFSVRNSFLLFINVYYGLRD